MSINRDITDFMLDIRDSIHDVRFFVQTMTYKEFTDYADKSDRAKLRCP